MVEHALHLAVDVGGVDVVLFRYLGQEQARGHTVGMEHGLEQVSDAWLVGRAVEQVLAANPKSIEDYRAGKEKAFGFLVGQVMRELKGRASPQVVNQTIREKLEQMK